MVLVVADTMRLPVKFRSGIRSRQQEFRCDEYTHVSHSYYDAWNLYEMHLNDADELC